MEQKRGSVLLFCPSFFGYDRRISQAIQDAGYDVELTDDRAGNDFFSKACIRFNLKCYYPVVRKYTRSLIKRFAGKKFDYVVVVKGEGVNTEAVDMLRKAYPEAKFVLYLWDSVANIPDCEKRMKLYDRVMTFDIQDAEQYGLECRPLFYEKTFQCEFQKKSEYKYDFAFIGTAHTCRPRIVKQLGMACMKNGKSYFAFLYLPHCAVFWYNKLMNRDYRGVRKKDISFEPMSSAQIKQVYEDSRCVLDIEHKKQRGLTMRTIELVGMQKKIITTNKSVTEYDFYDPANICVIDRENPIVDEAFWNSEFKPVLPDVLKKYSLEQFVEDILM